MYLPLGNLPTYFVPSLGSVLVQRGFAKPIQHEKYPRMYGDQLSEENEQKESRHPYRVSGVGFTTLFKLMNGIIIPRIIPVLFVLFIRILGFVYQVSHELEPNRKVLTHLKRVYYGSPETL